MVRSLADNKETLYFIRLNSQSLTLCEGKQTNCPRRESAIQFGRILGLGIYILTACLKSLDNKDQLPQLGIFREISVQTYNPTARNLSKKWIEDCLQNHTSCNADLSLLESAEMPTRIIDTTPVEGNADIRLVKGSDIGRERYIALSHCWGKYQQVKTTSENIDSMFRGISLQMLSQTFRDAVRICRDLGIRYLWIDSLCIIQNNAMEWRRESSHMSMVYGNALLVLAASISPGDELGMIRERPYSYCHIIDFNCNGGPLSLRMQPWIFHSNTNHDYPPFYDGPLAERAWAFQERLLGRRVLLFNRNELLWECKEVWRCECGVGDNKGDSNYIYNLHHWLEANRKHAELIYRSWRVHIVPCYASRNLTQPGDRLPAISGIAETFRLELEDDYLAGLWRKDLPRGLLWINLHSHPSGLPSRYRAPSWSWAAADCVPKYEEIMNAEFCVEVSEVCCKLLGKELTGEVTDGWLTICGPLGKALVRLPAEYFEKGSSESIHLCVDEDDYHGTSFRADFLLEVRTIQIEEDGVEEEIVVRSHMERSNLQRARMSPESSFPCSKISEVSLDVWCLKICQGDMCGMKDVVLVLGKSERQKGRYERLGLGKINSEKSRRAFAANAVNTVITIV
ncbi:hypothetical protein OCU04_002263 [Sclerotinia nivalis]|uniref:Heterokaryon incompatibility domain-containing protein n=1 Tax=Sclerotinia nivalis TaxID=352851 RepID=A0A9X0AZT0_9HELO|nr:hypothetical protein OCU04_002263 [Sclerotinia nivalis]